MRLLYLMPLLVTLLLGGCASLTGQSEADGAPSQYVIQKGDTLYSIAFRYGTDYRHLAAINGISSPYLIYPGQTLVVPGRDKDLSSVGDGPAPVLLKGHPTDDDWVIAQAPPLTTSMPAANPPPADKPPAAAKPVEDSKPAPPERSEAPKPAAPVTPEPAKGETSAVNVKSNISWRWPTSGKVIQRFAPANDKKGVDIAGKVGQPVLAAAAGDVVYSGSGLTGYGNLIIIKHDESHLSAYGHNKSLLVKQGDKVKGGQKIGEMGQSAKDGSILHFEIRRDGKPVDPLLYLPKSSSS